MTIVWREQMSVGNNLIDKEHRYLIDQINAVELALNSTDNHDILVETLNHLVEYTRTHFDHEEQIQVKIRYPDYAKHKQEHQKIMTDLDRIKDNLDKILGLNLADEASSEEVSDIELNRLLGDEVAYSVNQNDLAPLVGLVRNWVMDHVLVSDRKLKPLLKKLPPEFS